MKKPIMHGLSFCSVVVAILCSTIPSFGQTLSESRTLRKSLDSFDGRHLIVDNIWGSIVIRGHDGGTLEIVAQETLRAKTEERLERAKQEVELAILEREGEVELLVDGPFRCEDRSQRWCGLEATHYEAHYDFDLQVPYDTELTVRTVTDGDIEISGVRGNFQIHNVNGSIRLEGLVGSGAVKTVNGSLTASFAAQPTADSRFGTVNGEIDVSFPPDLSADLELAARWGEVWSEYEVEPLPMLPPTRRTRDGRTVIEISKGSRLRVGSGGPTLTFETLTGDIYLRKGT